MPGRGPGAGAADVNSRSIGIELANAGPLAASRRSPSRRWRRSRAARRGHGALGDPGGGGDRAFRHGAGPQGRPGAEVRLAPAGARRPGGLGGGAGGGAGDWEAFARRGGGAGYGPGASGRRCSRRSGCASGRGRAARAGGGRRGAAAGARGGAPCVDRRRGSDLDRGARMAGWPRPARVEESPDSRERWRRVTPARGDPRESATEIRPPAASARRARVKRWGKSPPRRRQRRRHGKPRQEQGQIGIARGLAPRVLPPERSGLAARARRRRRAQRNGHRRRGPPQNPAYRPSARLARRGRIRRQRRTCVADRLTTLAIVLPARSTCG